MASRTRQTETDGQGNSLQALLTTIDRETAPSLEWDKALLKERSLAVLRKKKPYVSYMLGENEMALSIDAIQEIGVLPVVTPLPFLPPWIKGIVQIRGEILSVVDFLRFCGLKNVKSPLRWSYLLFKQGDFKLCLMANTITGVVNLDEQRDGLRPLTSGETEHLAQLAGFVKGVFTQERRAVCIVDHEKLGSSSKIRKWQ
jgi:purine-binding chemotaxis protein CheW